MASSTPRLHSRTVSVPLETPSMWCAGLEGQEVARLGVGAYRLADGGGLGGVGDAQSRTVLSLAPPASVEPSRLNVSDSTESVCPASVVPPPDASPGPSTSQQPDSYRRRRRWPGAAVGTVGEDVDGPGGARYGPRRGGWRARGSVTSHRRTASLRAAAGEGAGRPG